ncbi:MAG: hypothetical protein EBX50_00895 [Chitinophagia bacterium]|nr:hypothetical protein [Chitinophagia bacterium]
MPKYLDLQVDKFYLITQHEGDNIDLVEVLLHTDHAILLFVHDEYETTVWKKKSDTFFEIIDELTDEQIEQYDTLFDEESDDEDAFVFDDDAYDNMLEDPKLDDSVDD